MKDDPEFNIYFVSLIAQNPCLYNYTCVDYRNVTLQEKTWEKIAIQVSESAHDCKERWKNLRGCYTRHLKHTASPSMHNKIKKPYYLSEYLNFLKPYTKTRKSRTHFGAVSSALAIASFPELIEGDNKNDSDSDEENHHDYDIRNQSPTQSTYDDNCFMAPPPKQMKENDINTSTYELFQMPNKNTNDNKYENNNMYRDSDLSFLISILPDMKEMNNDQKRKFKIGILKLAGQILNDSRAHTMHPNLSSTIPGYAIPKSETLT